MAFTRRSRRNAKRFSRTPRTSQGHTSSTSWAEVPVPPASAQAQLTDVSTAADLTLWAVGGQADLTQTLIYKKEN